MPSLLVTMVRRERKLLLIQDKRNQFLWFKPMDIMAPKHIHQEGFPELRETQDIVDGSI